MNILQFVYSFTCWWTLEVFSIFVCYKQSCQEFPLWCSRNGSLVSMRMPVRSLALLSGSEIWCCHELWCRSQMSLGSAVVVAVVKAGSCSSDLTPSLGTSICHGYSPKKQNKQKFRELPGSLVVKGFGIVTAVAQIQSLWHGNFCMPQVRPNKTKH